MKNIVGIQLGMEIIELPVSEWRAYKSLRLEALKTDQQAFAKPYDDEAAYPDEKWMERIERTKSRDAWMYFAKDTDIDELVGMIGGYRDEENRAKHSAQIWGVYVHPSYRGKGLSSILMSRILTEFEKNEDIAKAVLEVNIDQTSAIKLYEKFGFSVINRFTCTLGDGKKHEVCIMEKELI